MQLAYPGAAVPGYGIVSPGEYNTLVTNHGAIMIFWVAMPVLIAALRQLPDPADDRLRRHGVPAAQPPLVPDLPAERCRAAASSLVVPGGGFGGAWTCLPAALRQSAEYNLTPVRATSLWLIAVALEFVAFLLGGINFVTTAMNARAPGHEGVRHPDGGVDDRHREHPVHGVGRAADRRGGDAALRPDARHRASSTPPAAATRCSGSTCSGSSAIPRSTSCCCRPMGIVAEIITVFSRKKLFAYKHRALHRHRHRRALLHGLGAPPVHRRHRPAHGEPLHGHDAAHLDPDRRDDVRLHRHALRRLDHASRRRCCGRSPSSPSS